MGKKKTSEPIGLCWRCEHRIRFLESGGKWHPRCECGTVYQKEKDGEKIIDGHNSHACYMYKPVKPVTLEKAQSGRPFIPGMSMITARMSGTMDEDGKDFELHCEMIGRNKCRIYWLPVEKKEVKKKKV